MATSNDTELNHREGYTVRFHNVGGSEPDGTPTYIGPWTFKTGMVRRVVEDAMHGRVLNACAGKTHLSKEAADQIIRNDVNPEREADYHLDVVCIDDVFPADSFDTVVFDPPFDQTQADEHYESMHDKQRGPARRKLRELVRVGGTFIELGWNMHSVADQSDAWDREAVHIYRRGPSYQPVFLTIDRRNQHTLVD